MVGYSAFAMHFRPGYSSSESMSAAIEAYTSGQGARRSNMQEASGAGEPPGGDAYAGLRQQAPTSNGVDSLGR